MKPIRFPILLLAGLALALACDSGSSPVAPTDTLFSVTADPLKIQPDGTSEIRVLALHSSGVPARTGTEVRFRTTLGRVEPELARTDDDGVARATLHADGLTGTAEVTASSGASSADSVEVEIAVPSVTAKFEPSVSGLTVKFTDMSTGNPTSWQWDFGDGRTSRERNPLHEYSQAGSFRVVLTVANADASDTTTQLLAVGAVAGFTATASNANPLEVTFKDTSTGDPSRWEWKFGDGGTSRVQNPVHTYARAGEYVVRLKITTADSGTAQTSQVIRVEAAELEPPVADFDDPPSADRNGLTLIFRDKSTSGGAPTSWHWDFGDGSDSSERDPVHTFPAADTYVVTLTVANAAGSDSLSKFIDVN